MRNHLWGQVEKFARSDHLIIGICNGFQILVNLGLLPATADQFGAREIALEHNEQARYLDRWVDLEVQSDSVWLAGINQFPVAIAHGEGKLVASDKMLDYLRQNNMIALRYVKGDVCNYQNLK